MRKGKDMYIALVRLTSYGKLREAANQRQDRRYLYECHKYEYFTKPSSLLQEQG